MVSSRSFLAVFVTVAWGCGGSSTNTTPSIDGSTSDGTSMSSSGSDGSAGSLDEGIPGEAAGGSSGATSSGGASSGGSSSGATGDSGTVVVRSDGGADQIACGAGGVCDSTTQVCCATAAGRACKTIGTCAGDSLACSGSNSCTKGDVCCEELTAAGAIKTACVATACPGGSRQLCTTDAECGDGRRCVRGNDGYAICLAAVRDAAAD